jgi:uncharacterized protein (TIGR04255 family)
LRFEDKPEFTTPEGGLAFHRLLGGSEGPYARFDQLRAQSLQLELAGPSNPPVITQSGAGWQLRSADGTWIVALASGHVSLESTDYPGWEEFSSRLSTVVEALTQISRPALDQRIGLRYVDRITETDARTAAEWSAYLQPHVLGFAAHPQLGTHVANARQQLLLDLGEGYGAVINHGFLPRDDGNLDYLLDYDVYREGGRAFDLETLRETLDVLHSDAVKLFHASITPALHDIFRQP